MVLPASTCERTATRPQRTTSTTSPTANARAIREAGPDTSEGSGNDNEWSPAVRVAIGLVTARAAYAGYVLGRVLLGTLERKLHWSEDTEAGAQDLYDSVNRMEIVELAL